MERLSELAAAAGVERLVLTDINNTTGIPDFVRECRSRDITPAAGIEFRDGNRLLYIGIARNNEGFRELNEFLTHHNVTGEPLPLRPPSFPNAYVIYPADGGNSTGGGRGNSTARGENSTGGGRGNNTSSGGSTAAGAIIPPAEMNGSNSAGMNGSAVTGRVTDNIIVSTSAYAPPPPAALSQ